MAWQGMDVAAVTRVGQRLKAQSNVVRSTIRTVDGLIARAGAHWWGASGRRFVQDWQQIHRPALVDVATRIDALAGTALSNATAQEVTSAEDGTGQNLAEAAVHAVGTQDLMGAVSSLSASPWYSVPAAALGVSGALLTTYRGSEYGKLYRTLIGKDFFRYNRTLQHLYSPTVAKVLNSSPLKAFGVLGNTVSAIGAVEDLKKAYSHPAADHAGANRIEATGAAVGSVLKMSKNPVAYLSGVAVTSVSYAVGEATKIDLGYTGETFDYMKKNPTAIIEELGLSTKKMFTETIWKIL